MQQEALQNLNTAWQRTTAMYLFTEHAPAKALAVPVDRIHSLTTILRGTLILPRTVPHSPMGVWAVGGLAEPKPVAANARLALPFNVSGVNGRRSVGRLPHTHPQAAEGLCIEGLGKIQV